MSKLSNWTSSEGTNLLSRNLRTSPHGLAGGQHPRTG